MAKPLSKNFFTISLLFISMLFGASPLKADRKADNWYQVELLIFRQASNYETAFELPYVKTYPAGIIELLPPLLNETVDNKIALAYQLLPANISSLKEETQKLDPAGYSIIVANSWQQPIASSSHADLIHIVGGELLVTPLSYESPDSLQQAWEIDGTLKISSNYYMDVNLDLSFNVPKSTTYYSNNLGYLTTYLKESRRIRLGELNYFDHPQFGLLLRVSRITHSDSAGD